MKWECVGILLIVWFSASIGQAKPLVHFKNKSRLILRGKNIRYGVVAAPGIDYRPVHKLPGDTAKIEKSNL